MMMGINERCVTAAGVNNGYDTGVLSRLPDFRSGSNSTASIRRTTYRRPICGNVNDS